MQTIYVQQAAGVGAFFGFTLEELALKGPILACRPERGVVVIWEDHEDFVLYTLWRAYAMPEDNDMALYAYADNMPARGLTMPERIAVAQHWVAGWLAEL